MIASSEALFGVAPELIIDYVVPEPASALILVLGFAGTALRRNRK